MPAVCKTDKIGLSGTVLQGLFIGGLGSIVKADHHDLFQLRIGFQPLFDGRHSDGRRPLQWEPVDAGADRGKGHTPAALCRRLQVNAYHPDQRILAPGDLAALRDAGFAVNVWTVNDMSEAKRLVAEGATGIITDFPAACRKALGE